MFCLNYSLWANFFHSRLHRTRARRVHCSQQMCRPIVGGGSFALLLVCPKPLSSCLSVNARAVLDACASRSVSIASSTLRCRLIAVGAVLARPKSEQTIGRQETATAVRLSFILMLISRLFQSYAQLASGDKAFVTKQSIARAFIWNQTK